MTVSQLVNYLDREEIAEAKERRMRRRLRNLSPKLRKFCLALKRVMVDERGPEIYIRKKVCSALKIGHTTYYSHLKNAEKLLP